MFVQPMIAKLEGWFVNFRKQEDGATTIEFVLWLPVFALLLALVADTALIMGGQAQVLRVVQDVNRSMSVGRITLAADAQQMILDSIRNIAPSATVTTTYDEATGLISSRVLIPARDLTATGLVASFSNLNVPVFAQHLSEK